uniref:Uncharacterized protein n=1 Tax=Arundo donax TaxID=35708 RepID=A0A0A8YZZ6_ARUDO
MRPLIWPPPPPIEPNPAPHHSLVRRLYTGAREGKEEAGRSLGR